MPEVVEDADTFEGNGRKKALALAARVPPGSWAVADDSGLCVDALGGEPGVHSAYYAGHPTDNAANNAKLIAALRGVPLEQRTAAFHCCLVAVAPDGQVHVFEGRCPGRILSAPAGTGGFGYDPLFLPDGQERTAAELPPEIKHRISHRGRALARFIAWLQTNV
jgi:XTP/dITP diphosphohydrolase